MEDLPPRFQRTINDNVVQSFDNALQNDIPAALQLTIHTAVANALAAALPDSLAAALADTLPPLLAPINDKLTRMEITQAKVGILIRISPHTYGKW